MEVQLHAFLTSALDRSDWSTSHPGRFTLGGRTPVSFGLKANGPQSRSGRGGEEKNPFSRRSSSP